jgi:hypothetical protein
MTRAAGVKAGDLPRGLKRRDLVDWLALPEGERAAFDAWLAEFAPEKFAPELRHLRLWLCRLDYASSRSDGATPQAALADEEADIVRSRRHDVEVAEREARRRAEQEAHRAEQEAHRAERRAAREQAVAAVVLQGRPVPEEFAPRRAGGRCVVCWRPLHDPESRRLGIGPDCLREARRLMGAS